MKYEYTFKHLDCSESLADYALQQISKLEKFEFKPSNAHFCFSVENKHEKRVDVTIHGATGVLKAHAVNEDLYVAVDSTIDKLSRQLSKKKERVQNHKKKKLSPEGIYKLVNPDFDYDYTKLSRSAKRKQTA